MGDIAVDIFLETLKQLITNSKLRSIIDEKHQLQSLETEIKYLREFLKVTVKKRNEHIEVMNLVRQIRDVVFESENTVELFVSYAYKLDHLSGWDKFFEWFRWDRFCESLFLCKLPCNDQDYPFLDLQSVKKAIKTLTAKVKQIYDENIYDINGSGTTVKKLKHSFIGSSGSGGSSSYGGRNTSKVVEEKSLVGFKDEVKTLMGKLHDIGEGGRLEIISIIGVGGGGKTTLAREVYDHPLTLQKFEICAWANVSQGYHKTMKRDLLVSILESASPRKQEGCGELGEKVYKCLQGRKYLIVMDDIWDIEAWNDIQRSFPRECKGSKVMLTSRLPVQPASIPCVPHCLNPLPKGCSWELLEKKVFGKKQCPLELVDIGKQIAGKCKGLPLAVVAIAGILAMQDKTLDVWKKVAKNLSSIIAKNQEGCMEILELSYNHLPLHLKACFLYIGGHPEDFEIPVRELIWLWIAEGFIQQSDGEKNLEAIAQDYLIGLIDRNLVMVATKSKSHGGIKACRIHDLLRELCLKKAKEDNFLVQNYEDDSFSSSATNKHRRLFVCHHHNFSELPLRPHVRNLRSFLFLPLPNFSPSRLGLSYPITPGPHSMQMNRSFVVENFELLRVYHLIFATNIKDSGYGGLDNFQFISAMRGHGVFQFVSAMSQGQIGRGDLVHLRYLALTFPAIERFPGMGRFHAWHSLRYFLNLETLILVVPCREGIWLPWDIIKMVKLRHLYTKRGVFIYHHCVCNYDENEENMLYSLQTLHRMCVCEDCVLFLKRTPNLRKLRLFGRGRSTILLDIEFLKCLEILYLEPWRVPVKLKLPPTLTRLTLCYTGMKWEELSIILQTLPSLEVLKLLRNACVGPVWNTSELEEGFAQLKYLKFEYLDIEEWSASEDQFPVLEVLAIESCKKLKRIPIDFANLNELHEITIRWSSPTAEESAREIQEKQRNRRGDDDCLNVTSWGNW